MKEVYGRAERRSFLRLNWCSNGPLGYVEGGEIFICMGLAWILGGSFSMRMCGQMSFSLGETAMYNLKDQWLLNIFFAEG